MASLNYDPYTGDGVSIDPHLPSTDNLGGTLKEDEGPVPDPQSMPCANDQNTVNYCVAAQGRTSPSMVISIDFNSGDPYVYGLTTTNSGLDSGDISLTDNGNGDTSIEWPASSFPVVNGVLPHGLTMNDSSIVIERTYADPIANGVRVKTQNGSGTGLDCMFTLTIQGQ